MLKANELTICDKEKGLDSWRLLLNQTAFARSQQEDKVDSLYGEKNAGHTSIVSLCASHAAKNGGGHTRRDQKSQGVSYAKAGTLYEKKYIEKQMRTKKMSENFVNYMIKHFDEYYLLLYE